MIRLARVTLREIRLPLREPFKTSTGVVEERRILLLHLSDTDGIETWSECVAEALPTYSPDTVDTCWLAISEWIIPMIIGKPLDTPQSAHAILSERIRGHQMARAAVEMGIWALSAAQGGVALATLLATQSKVASETGAEPRTEVETGIALGVSANPESLANKSAAARADGYRRVKLKIGPGRDIDYIRAARDAVGVDIALSVDANGSYSIDDRHHVQTLEEIDKLGLSMIEQPLAHDDLVHHADLQRLLQTPICLDESISTDANVEEMLALGSARMVNLKPGRVGGFQQALAIHDRCANAEVPVWCGGMLESGIGRAYNVALASLPNFRLPGDLSPSERYWQRDVVKQPWTMNQQGRVKVPLDRTGTGVDPDEDFIDELTVRTAKFSA